MKKILIAVLFLMSISLSKNLHAQVFIAFDNLKGESTAADHAAKFETQVMSLTFGGTNATTIGAATGGAGAGKVKFDAITFMKSRGPLSSELFKQMAMGGHYNNVKISFYKPGAQAWMTITLSSVWVTSMSMSASEADPPVESIQLSFGSILFEETYPAAAGQMPKIIRSGWNVITNTAM